MDVKSLARYCNRCPNIEETIVQKLSFIQWHFLINIKYAWCDYKEELCVKTIAVMDQNFCDEVLWLIKKGEMLEWGHLELPK